MRCLKQEYNRSVITSNTTNYFVTNIMLRCTTEGVHLTFAPHVFFRSLKSGACYITGQWG